MWGFGLTKVLFTLAVVAAVLSFYRWYGLARMRQRDGLPSDRRRRGGTGQDDDRIIDMVKEGETYVPARQRRRGTDRRRS